MDSTKRYINQAGFAAQLGVAPQALYHRLANDMLPPPDVYIGNVVLAGRSIPGWSPERISAYIEFTREYLVLVQPSNRPRLRLPAHVQLPHWWDVPTEWFLNQKEAARILGLESGSVATRMSRDTFGVQPRVIVGGKWHGIAKGWDREDVETYGLQDMYLDDRARIVDKGRNGPPRKSVDPDFYHRRAAKRAQIRQAA